MSENRVDNEEVVDVVVEEETPKKEKKEKSPKQPKKKKEKNNLYTVVDKMIKKSNLPVYDVGESPNEFMTVETEQPLTKKKKISNKKKLLEEQKEKLRLLEQRILEEDTAAYVQVVKDKNQTKKIIRYNTDLSKGLSSEIIEHRKLQNLTNAKDVGSTKTIPTIILSNTFTFFNLLNFAIAGWLISALGFDAWKYIFFIGIVTANLVISIVQEIRSKMVIDKLSILSAPNATILRDGVVYDIPITDVVLDDILVLSSGRQIASDSILVEGGIEVNESLLTGESDSIAKKPGDILYAGSFVVSGNCKARIERVGKDNYIEKLTNQAKKYRKPKSDLLKTLTSIIRFVGVLIIPLGTLVFISQYEGANWGGSSTYLEAVLTTSGAVIGMIPSGLFLLTSVALAVGVIRLAQNNTLVQE